MSGPNDPIQRQLLAAFEAGQLSTEELWLHYFSLGGDAGKVEIDAYMNGLMRLSALQHDILAHAINELLGELNPPRAPYSLNGVEHAASEASSTDGRRGRRRVRGDGERGDGERGDGDGDGARGDGDGDGARGDGDGDGPRGAREIGDLRQWRPPFDDPNGH